MTLKSTLLTWEKLRMEYVLILRSRTHLLSAVELAVENFKLLTHYFSLGR